MKDKFFQTMGLVTLIIIQVINLIFTVFGFCYLTNLPIPVGIITWVLINLVIYSLAFYLLTQNARED